MTRATLFLLLSVLLFSHQLKAQQALWVTQLAGAGDADSRACRVAPNGNIYLAGSFSGAMDLDPSPSVFNVVSNGQRDIFLACYNAGGVFIWGFSVGGAENDVVKNLAVDANSNAILVGQYRGFGIDFNPGAGVKNLNSVGVADGFVAVYNSNGGFIWANTIGGATEFDDAQSAIADAAGNVYIGGNFHSTMDIDPAPAANKFLNSGSGTAFLIKYNSSGQLVWGFNFGGGGNAGVDNAVWAIQTDNKGYLYLAGCYAGANSDFDPSTSSTLLTASGPYDGFVAKYSTDGALQYVTDIKGPGSEQVIDLALDNAGDMYTIGYTESSSVKFSAVTGAVAKPAGSDKSNIFIARYNNSGQVKWGNIVGGMETDFGWGIAVANGFVYCTGYFQDGVDFDPSINTGNLSAKGKNDIFLARYDRDGNYVCSFNVGDIGHDNAYKLAADPAGNLYMCGYFSPANVDFGPFSSTFNKSSTGGADVFLAKYDWSNAYTPPSGYLVGDTVCEGDEVFLQFIATSGAGPFLITYTDGTTVFTQSVLESGEKFAVPGGASKSKQYKLTRIKDNSPCTPPGEPDADASIWVNPKPYAEVSNDTEICPGATIQLFGGGGIEYHWFPSQGLSDDTVADPLATVHQSTKYSLVATNIYGCVDTAVVNVSIRPADFKVKEINDVCIGDTIQLSASGGDVYLWSPTDSLSAPDNQLPYVWVKQSCNYLVYIKDTVCNRETTLTARVEVHPLPDVQIYIAKDMDCGLDHAQLGAAGALTYAWQPAESLTDPNAQFTDARPSGNTIYTVCGTDNWTCQNFDSIEIKVFTGKGRLFAPDAFTPNLDGKNDCYRVHIPGEITNYELSISNRWGQEVFHTNDFSACWDGTIRGQLADMGTYFYFYKAKSSICDDLFGKGGLQLIR